MGLRDHQPGHLRRREDDSKVRTGHLPRAMASLRNLAINVFRQNTDREAAPSPRTVELNSF
ncbi:putative transposase YbfD/YdcC [Streptomyces aurantiacus]|uniref:hypothetical protein n=1 Tax=Streptomyces aurantiacus TaxID=47760 RepID=UPI00278D3432|nr:hypothetical protein [Streptomyces aurantiacus]MDQ0773628.1 putative transposase YbfD/YdcC [Streptomyces aurantiacus]